MRLGGQKGSRLHVRHVGRERPSATLKSLVQRAATLESRVFVSDLARRTNLIMLPIPIYSIQYTKGRWGQWPKL